MTEISRNAETAKIYSASLRVAILICDIEQVVRFTMYFCSNFWEIWKTIYFWKAYNIRSLKINVCICTDACIVLFKRIKMTSIN